MKQKIIFNNIGPIKQREWSKVLKATLSSLTSEELAVVPDIYVYQTMISSLVNNFSENSFLVDDIAAKFYKGSSWAYAYLGGDIMKEQYISFSIERYYQLNEFVTPEFTIFHEVGHFQLHEREKKEVTFGNLDEIEMMCDRFGLYALVRMLYHNPNYKTIAESEVQQTFEDSIKNLINQNITAGKRSKAYLNRKFKEIVETVIDLMNWDNIYDNREAS